MNSLHPAANSTIDNSTTACYPIDFGDNDQVVIMLLQAGALSRIVGDSHSLGQTFSPHGSGTQNRDVVASLGSTLGTAMKRLALGLIQNDTTPVATTAAPPPPTATPIHLPPPNSPIHGTKSKSYSVPKPKSNPKPKPKPMRTLVHYGAQEGTADIQF